MEDSRQQSYQVLLPLPCFVHGALPVARSWFGAGDAQRCRLRSGTANLLKRLRTRAQVSGPSAGDSPDDSAPDAVTPLDEPVIVDLSVAPQHTKKVRQRTGSLVREIDRELDVSESLDTSNLPPVHLDEMADCARTAVRAADRRKCLDPVVFRVSNVSCITTFMVCVTGKNPPQIRAIANLVEEDLFKEHGLKPKHSSRAPNSGWLLLDYGDLMVHVFSPEQRLNYRMESLWRHGEQLDISDCIVGPDADSGIDELSSDDWLPEAGMSGFADGDWGSRR